MVTKAQKRWRLSFFSIHFSNTLLSTVSVKKLGYNRIPGIVTTESCTALEIIPQATDTSEHAPRFSSIDQLELIDLVKSKDLQLLHKFNGVKGLAESLDTNLERGIITTHDILKRKNAFGSNTYEKPLLKGFVYFLAEAFKDTTVLVLLTCATLSLGFSIKENGAKEGWHEGGGIFVSVFLVITVSALSNLRQERHFGRLSKMNNNVQTDVIREGRRQKVPISSLVVGDVVVLHAGDQIPADGLFIDGNSLLIDESRITGEIDHINIDATEHPFMFSGSKVAYGDGQMLVTSVGMKTSWGKMMSSVTDDSNKQTPRPYRLNKLTSFIAKLGLAGTLLDLLITSIRYATGLTKDKNGNWKYNGQCIDTNDILNSFVNVVVAISEGLPLAITLTRACSIKRMMADQAMVRKKSACETMGSVNVICTDKTGVLTLNSMKVDEFWIGLRLIKGDLSRIIDKKVLQLYHEGVGLNTTGRVYKSVIENAPEYSGSPTEIAIISWAVRNLGMDMEKVKQDSTILHVETFNPEKKRSGVSIRKKEDNTIHVHWKGAAEMVLAMCSKYYQKNGLIKSINNEEKTELEKIIQGMAARSLRCIAFAHKEDGTSDNEEGLTLLGIVGIKDPCRPGAKEAIDTCRSAGVEIKMITGDNVFTAKAIATECGILEAGQHVSEGEVIEGEEFRNYTDDERMKKVESIKVMARSSPSDKLLMVQCLKRKGHVVAVTGHGSNDVPSLKEADIGLSMGIQGTEVAKENSDIVILNDDIHAVVMVLMWGRCVYNNIQKFIQFQLAANVAAFVINFVNAASAGGIPLIPVQQLWINLIINFSGSLALTTERPTKELMHQSPVGRDAPLITNVMWRNLLAQSVYQIVILLTFQFSGRCRSIFKVSKRVTNIIILNIFVLCQVFNKLNSRKLEKRNVLEGLHKNRVFIGVIGVTVILQVVIVEFLNNFAGTEKLNWEQWVICIAIAALSLPIGWIVKLIPVPDRPFLSYLQEWISDTEQATGPQSNIQMFNKPKTL